MTSSDDSTRRTFGRRDLLLRGGAGLGAMAVGAPALALNGLAPAHSSALANIQSVMAASCTLTPSNVQGPFWLNLALLRQDITEGTVGHPISFYVKLVDAATCAPIVGGVVDLWHDDPDGHYSGFASEGTAGQTQLRGIQVTGLDGMVRFDSIYPGWYAGRTPHIHIKINPNAGSELTTQIYFPDVISERVYTQPPYDLRGPSPTTNATDGFYLPALEMGVRFRGPSLDQMVAGMTIAIV